MGQLHLSYVYEESQAQSETRKTLEGYVYQYLCAVPQERKFCNPLIGDVIAESARWIPDFSTVKAAQAFTLIESYAWNVIYRPRKVREIKVNSFFQGYVKVLLVLERKRKVFNLINLVISYRIMLDLTSTMLTPASTALTAFFTRWATWPGPRHPSPLS